MGYVEQKTCRICGHSNLKTVFDLGYIHPSVFLDAGEELPAKMPLTVVQCENCGLVQLAHAFDLDDSYRQYYYRSGINPSMVAALKDIVDCAMKIVPLQAEDVICDIGANDGTLLTFYPDDVVKVAFEPALNIVEQTRQRADYLVNDYFDLFNYPISQKSKIITSIAMFYDLPSPPRFVGDVMSILDDDGIWVMQITDLVSMLKANAFDAVCFEHTEYYSTNDIVELVKPFGLEVFRIDHNDVNGGSLRFYIGWKGAREVEWSVFNTLESESRYLQSSEGGMGAFSLRVSKAREALISWLIDSKARGEKVYGIAASTKGNTLLQAFGHR